MIACQVCGKLEDTRGGLCFGCATHQEVTAANTIAAKTTYTAGVTIDLKAAIEVAMRCGKYEALVWEISRALQISDPTIAVQQIRAVGRNILDRSDWG